MYHCSWRRLGHTRHLKRSIGKWSQESCPERLRLLKTGKKNSLLLISIGFGWLLLIFSSKGALPGGHFNDSLSFGETMF